MLLQVIQSQLCRVFGFDYTSLVKEEKQKNGI